MKQQNPANTPRGSNITNYFVKLPLYAIHKNYNVNSMLHVIRKDYVKTTLYLIHKNYHVNAP